MQCRSHAVLFEQAFGIDPLFPGSDDFWEGRVRSMLRRGWRRWRFWYATIRLRRLFRPIVEERRRGFVEVQRELESLGWSFTTPLGGAAPLQGRGRLPSGESFYLRCRWDSCTLNIGAGVDPTSDELVRDPDWSGEWAREDWGAFGANWAEPRDVFEALIALEARYRAELEG